MYRYIAGIFSLTVITLSVLGVLSPQGSLSILMDTSPVVAIVRICCALLLFTYSLSPLLRYDFLRDSLLFVAFSCVGMLIYGLFTESITYPEPLDIFFALQGSMIAIIASLDFARPKAVQKFLPNITVFDLLLAKLKQASVTETPTLRKVSPNH